MDYLTAEQVGFEIVAEPARAKEIIKSLKGQYAIDLETTALHPKDGKVRLTTLYNDKDAYIFDHEFCGSFEKLSPSIAKSSCAFICFHIVFEGLWFDAYAPEEITLWDVAFMRKSVQGGGGFKLGQMSKWDLNIDLDKGLQTSDWSALNLTTDQYIYAGYDGYVTWELFKYWRKRMNEGHWNGFRILNNAWRANIEMEDTALYLDVAYHKQNIKTWELKRDTAIKYFRRFTPEGILKNPNSNKQMSDFLKRELDEKAIKNWPRTPKTPHLLMDQSILKTAARRLPYPMNRWLAAFVIIRYYNKYLSTYGNKMVNSQLTQGKLKTKFNMAQAITCRYSSSSHNLQNIPRKVYVRKAFTIRAGKNEKMILADYKGIEVRVAAELSHDEVLLRDTIYGNVHATGAAIAHNIEEGYFLDVLDDKNNPKSALFKGYRQIAKIGTFRLLYGAGVAAIGDSMHMSDDNARGFIERWATKYRRTYQYRFSMQTEMLNTGYIPVVDGRTIYVRKADRQLPIAANYPIQSAAASVMYAALYRVRQLLLKCDFRAKLAACVHDEIIMYAHVEDAATAHDCLVSGMEQGWLDVFPGTSVVNLVESAIGTRWSDKP